MSHNVIYSDQQDSSSPYAKGAYLGLLRSVENDRRRVPPLKPYGLGGPKRRKEHKSKPKPKGNRITLRIIGKFNKVNRPLTLYNIQDLTEWKMFQKNEQR